MQGMTLYWHDYETFGADPRLDRPAQFAGLRTNTDLEVVDEPLVLYCRPADDYLPHPEACLITGITPQEAEARGVSEPEFIARVLDELGAPGTCGVGYNSLRFDDEVTRHTAWRNFFDPYAREWQQGCSRWDIIDMVRLTYALRPDGVTWPRRDDGAPSFRLEDLAAANGLAQERAHDALSDVHATLDLARLIRDRRPKLYDYVFGNRDKRSARAMLDLDGHKPVLHVSEKFPAELGCLSLVMPLAPHPVNGNAVLVFDLRRDPADLLALSPEDLHERLFTPSEDLPDDVERIPIKAVQVNKCPVLAPVETLPDDRARDLDLDLARCRRHWKALHDDIEAVAAKVQAAYALGEFQPNDDPEQDLYGGFVPDADRDRCERLRQLDGAALAADPPAFEDPRLRTLLFRYRARHHPETLTGEEADAWAQWRENRLRFAPDGGLSLDDYALLLQHLAQGPAGRDPEKRRILEALTAWGQRLETSL
ncbi:exonuclease I [Salinisphaera sp. PC39]|uniref:exodeoxyribonuclease I n=1 Tax=Salinisphaera sp. PC39 TaxID=1304156 RepID=UPI003342C050